MYLILHAPVIVWYNNSTMKKLTQYTPSELQTLFIDRKISGPTMSRFLRSWQDTEKGYRITTDVLDYLDASYNEPPLVEILYTAFHGDIIIAQASYLYGSKEDSRISWTNVKAHTPKGDAVMGLILGIAEYMETIPKEQSFPLASVWNKK